MSEARVASEYRGRNGLERAIVEALMNDPGSFRMATLVSFDIDGTLEVGDPPGIITIPMVASVKRRGCVIGSCSDRPLSYQRALWERLAIIPDFTVLKHRLADVKARFSAEVYYHIGDTDVDDHFATAAGFEFLRADATAHESWGPRLFGSG